MITPSKYYETKALCNIAKSIRRGEWNTISASHEDGIRMFKSGNRGLIFVYVVILRRWWFFGDVRKFVTVNYSVVANKKVVDLIVNAVVDVTGYEGE